MDRFHALRAISTWSQPRSSWIYSNPPACSESHPTLIHADRSGFKQLKRIQARANRLDHIREVITQNVRSYLRRSIQLTRGSLETIYHKNIDFYKHSKLHDILFAVNVRVREKVP